MRWVNPIVPHAESIMLVFEHVVRQVLFYSQMMVDLFWMGRLEW